MNQKIHRFVCAFGLLLSASTSWALELVGLSVTPHVQSSAMRYRRPPDPQLGARVELFLRHDGEAPLKMGPDFPAQFDGKTPGELIAQGDWAWHDTPGSRPGEIALPKNTVTVWAFNAKKNAWGAGTEHVLDAGSKIPLKLQAPKVRLTAITFLGQGEAIAPNRLVVHVANDSDEPLGLSACRLWLPESKESYRVLRPGDWRKDLAHFTETIPARDRGGFVLNTGPLPLTYAAVEARTSQGASLWAHLRIKREVFDISGGWVADGLKNGNTLHHEPYLKTLRRMHINAGMHQHVPGYSDTPLFERYPLKYMNRLQPLEQYDTDAMLPRIHAVEFLGEPQYGGGRPVPPQEVFKAFVPYGPTRLPTSVTHSEERVWRHYAGLSDYPHYDAYRVTAPSPDSWTSYDRWGGERLRWGAPLETVGDMTRSLRDLNQPRPIAYWSQGPHHDWGGSRGFAGRQRTSPTPDEMRAQAYHALAQRITSLYWFNLSAKSLRKFRDLIEPITRVGREIRLMEDILLEGDAYEYRREPLDGKPSWDLASVASPEAAIFFALDLAYAPDPQEKVFRFTPREGSFVFRLPTWLSKPAEVFRMDADGLHDVTAKIEAGQVRVQDRVQVAGIYIIAKAPGPRERLQARHRDLLQYEASFGFDPAKNDSDFAELP